MHDKRSCVSFAQSVSSNVVSIYFHISEMTGLLGRMGQEVYLAHCLSGPDIGHFSYGLRTACRIENRAVEEVEQQLEVCREC